MSSDTLSPEIMQSLSEQVRMALVEIIPDIIRQLTPVMIDIIRESAPAIANSAREQITQTQVIQQAEEEKKRQQGEIFNEFKGRHTKKLNEIMGEKQKWHQRYLTLTWQLQLYEEFLTNGECYIPREFRKDEYYVHDEEELASVVKFEEQRFRSEVEIMSKTLSFKF